MVSPEMRARVPHGAFVARCSLTLVQQFVTGLLLCAVVFPFAAHAFDDPGATSAVRGETPAADLDIPTTPGAAPPSDPTSPDADAQPLFLKLPLNLGPDPIVPPKPWQLSGIRAGLADASPEVARAAIQIADEHGWGSWLEPGEVARFLCETVPYNSGEAKGAAARTLARMGARAKPYAGKMVELLASSKPAEAQGAAEAILLLYRVDPTVIPASAIAPLLNTDRGRPNAPAIAATLLGRMGTSGAAYAAEVATLLRIPNDDLRLVVTVALSQMGAAAAPSAPQIAALLQKETSREVQTAAIETLAKLGPAGEKFAPQIASVLQYYPVPALKALEQMPGAGLDLDALVLPLLKWDGPCGADAAAYLGRRAKAGAPLAARVAQRLASHNDEDSLLPTIDALGQMGEEGVGASARVVPMLRNAEPEVRAAAARALAKMSEVGGGIDTQVAPLLKDADSAIRCAALEALGGMGTVAASHADEVEALLRDSDVTVRSAAIQALGSMGLSSAAISEKILPALRDSDATVRVTTVQALVRMGPNGAAFAEKIVPLLRDPEGEVRAAVARALAQMGSDDAAFPEKILPLLRDSDPAAREGAVEALDALSRPGDSIALQIAPLINDPEEAVSTRAFRSFIRPGAETTPYASDIARFLFREGCEAEALEALEKMGAPGRAFVGEMAWRLLDYDLGEARAHFRETLLRMSQEDPSMTRALLPLLLKPDESLPEILDILDASGNQFASEKERISWLAAVLTAFQSPETEDNIYSRVHVVRCGVLIPDGIGYRTALRAHLRLWCGGDTRLELALDWLAAADTETRAARIGSNYWTTPIDNPWPDLAALTPERFQMLVGIIIDLREATNEFSRGVYELDALLKKLAGTAQAGALPPEISARLERALVRTRARSEALRDAIQQAEKIPSDSPTDPAAAALSGSIWAVHDEMYELCVEQNWRLPLDETIRMLEKTRWQSERGAAVLGQMGRRGAIFAPYLLPALHGSPLGWKVFVTVLGEMGRADPAVAKLVAGMLDLPEEGKSHAGAILALGKMGKVGAPYAGRIATFLNGHLRHEAEVALGEMGIDTAPYATQIGALLHDCDHEVVMDTAMPLSKAGLAGAKFARAATRLLSPDLQGWVMQPPDFGALFLKETAAVFRAMADADPSAPASLLPMLRNPGADGNFTSAIDALGMMGSAAAPYAEELLPYLAYPNSPAGSSARRALEAISAASPPKTAFRGGDLFTEFLKSSDVGSRFAMAVFLGQMGTREFAPQVAGLLKDADAEVQKEAARSLCLMAQRYPTLAEQVMPLLANADVEIRLAAIIALGKADGMDSATLTRQLAPLLGDSEASVRLGTALALYRMGQRDRLRGFQDALDWLGTADPSTFPGRHSSPDPQRLSPAQLRELLATFSDLWEAAQATPEVQPAESKVEPLGNQASKTPQLAGESPAGGSVAGEDSGALAAKAKAAVISTSAEPSATPAPPPRAILFNEFAGIIECLAAATPRQRDADLAAILRKLRAQCEKRESVRQTIDLALDRTVSPAQ